MGALRFCLAIAALFLLQLASTDAAKKYRVCVVDVAGKSSKVTKHCGGLRTDVDSQVECVLGNTRLECLGKISQGKADFTVLDAEEIVVAASFKNTDFLITNDIRFDHEAPFAYEMVAVVRKSANIGALSDLKDKYFCHAGYGYERGWSEVISRFFEARVVPQICNSSLSLVENRIRSSSEYFRAACKPGPWVPNYALDAELKSKFPNLCELCDNPNACSVSDKYWGRLGPLYCLSDGPGDVSWSRLDDVRTHFAINNSRGNPAGNPADFAFLCRNGSMAPLTSASPCVWLARPWAAVAVATAAAEAVQTIVAGLETYEAKGWRWSLDRLLTESTAEGMAALQTMKTPEDYLTAAPGFTSANSLSDCTPGRPVRLCSSSSPEHAKCGWLKEAAKAFGVEPGIVCLRAKTTRDCLKVVMGGAADVVMTTPDLELPARRDFGLTALLHEFSNNMANLFAPAAVVRASSTALRLADLRGLRACFPSYDGAAWNTAAEMLKNSSLIGNECPTTKAMSRFFADSCVPGLAKTAPEFQASLRELCKDDPVDALLASNDADLYKGEAGAFRCLVAGKGDVAFIDLATIANNTDGANQEGWARDLRSADFRPLCLDNSTALCYLSWATPGQVMIKADTAKTRREELLVTFLKLDDLFGQRYKTQTPTFQLFAEFNGEKNVLFHDKTHRLEERDSVRRDGPELRSYEDLTEKFPTCTGVRATSLSVLALALALLAPLV